MTNNSNSAQTTFELTVEQTRFTHGQYLKREGEITRLLSIAHANDRSAKCHCTPNNGQLYVKQGKGGGFILCKMPNTGGLHSTECRFYEPPEAERVKAKYESAILEDEEGFSLKFQFPMSVTRKLHSPSSVLGTMGRTSLTRRASIGLLGTLHYLWQESKNNFWFPVVKGRENAQRKWRNVIHFLGPVIKKGKANGMNLEDLIFVVPPYDSVTDGVLPEFKAFSAGIIESMSNDSAQAKKPVLRKLVLGHVKSFGHTQDGYGLRFRGLKQTFAFDKDLHESAKKSYPLAVSAIQQEDDYAVVCLAMISARGDGTLVVETLCFMTTNKNFIPIDSSFEKQIADKLIAEKRRFEKPLRYDFREATLPDFVLLDTNQSRWLLEVYGVTGMQDYNDRKAEKREYYRKTGTKCWEWEPASSPPPDFPALKHAPKDAPPPDQ